MAWSPISNSVPQYSKDAAGTSASGYYIKFYAMGTTTPINMASDSTGGGLLAKAQLNSLGYPLNGSSAIFIPYLDQNYNIALFTNATDADNDTLASAVWNVSVVLGSIETNISTAIESQLGSQAVSNVFTLANITYVPAGQNLIVFRNGQKLILADDYTETSSNTVTLTSAPNDTDKFEFLANLATSLNTIDTSAATHIVGGASVNLATYLQNQDYVNLNDHGLSTTNTGAQNDAAFQLALSAARQTKSGFFIACRPMIVKAGTYQFSSTMYFKESIVILGDGGGQDGGWPVVFQWPVDTAGMVFFNYNTNQTGGSVFIETTPTTGSDNFILKGIKLQGGGGTGTANGIEQRVRGLVENVNIDGFSGHNHAIIANGIIDPLTSGNANNWKITGSCRYTNAGLDGLFIDGGDTNAGVSNNLDCSTNGRYGINDSSFLGNTHVGAHTNGNASGQYISDGANAFSVFLGCYSESGWPASNIKHPAMVIGGDHGAGFTTDTTAIRDVAGQQAGKHEILATLTSARQLSKWNSRDDNELTTLIASGDIANGLQRDWWDETTKTWRTIHGRDVGNRTAIAYTTDLTTTVDGAGTVLPAGRVWLEDYYQGQVPHRGLQASSKPTTGTYAIGDIIYARSPAPSGYIGWVCTTSGDLATTGVLKGFGLIQA